MSTAWNIYCDESCHLEKDRQTHMVLGGLACPTEKARDVAETLRAFKAKHGVKPGLELKWNKVSKSKLALYEDWVDYFFSNQDLQFRAIIIAKDRLDHAKHLQTHDTFYYKMYFRLLEPMLSPEDEYRIYLDIKDTRSAAKLQSLEKFLQNTHLDFDHKIVRWIQHVRSHEIEQMQLVDLLIGAVAYANRELHTSPSKLALVRRLRRLSGLSLTKTTLLRSWKVNLLDWKGSEGA